jgi:hypothetical protein
MFSAHKSWLRAAIILALALVVSSDAALASFLCPHMSGCENGMPAAANSNPAAENTAGAPMQCCPVKPQVSMDCDVSAMECCVWHHSDTDVTALLCASDQPRPRQPVALLPAVALVAPVLSPRDHVPGLADDLAYFKPVTQKKTDLRI